jgi:hypothetical protein
MSGEIQRAPEPKAPIALTNDGFVAQDLEGAFRLAAMMVKAGIAGKHTAESATLAIGMGRTLGLSAAMAVQNIAVINGKPAAYGELPLALARRSGLIAAFSEAGGGSGDDYGWTCTIVRKDDPNPIVRRFTVKDAKRAGLWGKSGPWTNYPDRMLMFRARGFALRDSVPEALNGLSVGEEAEDIAPPKSVPNDSTDHKSRTSRLEEHLAAVSGGKDGDGPGSDVRGDGVVGAAVAEGDRVPRGQRRRGAPDGVPEPEGNGQPTDAPADGDGGKEEAA